jgi:hypothetical protein
MPKRYKLRIDKKNAPLLLLPEKHPARRVLIAQAECRRDCVGRELSWEGSNQQPIDQEWQAIATHRKWTFSGFAYTFLAFDLILHGWLDHPRTIAPDEAGFLEKSPLMKALLAECQLAAQKNSNEPILQLIEQVGDFIDIWDNSVRCRLREDQIELEELR